MFEKVHPLGCAVLVLGVCGPLTAQTTKNVSFANDVAPLLSRACMKCHGLASPTWRPVISSAVIGDGHAP